MALPPPSAIKARIIHRYLGFFLAGVMSMYAVTGIVLVFRNTDFLKHEVAFAKTIDPGIDPQQLGKALDIRRLNVEKIEGNIISFKGGTYNSMTGQANWTKKELPRALGALTKIHKATTNSPLYFFNIAFGLSLIAFVITSFWMYLPGGPILRKGLLFTLAGIILVVIMLIV